MNNRPCSSRVGNLIDKKYYEIIKPHFKVARSLLINLLRTHNGQKLKELETREHTKSLTDFKEMLFQFKSNTLKIEKENILEQNFGIIICNVANLQFACAIKQFDILEDKFDRLVEETIDAAEEDHARKSKPNNTSEPLTKLNETVTTIKEDVKDLATSLKTLLQEQQTADTNKRIEKGEATSPFSFHYRKKT